VKYGKSLTKGGEFLNSWNIHTTQAASNHAKLQIINLSNVLFLPQKYHLASWIEQGWYFPFHLILWAQQTLLEGGSNSKVAYFLLSPLFSLQIWNRKNIAYSTLVYHLES